MLFQVLGVAALVASAFWLGGLERRTPTPTGAASQPVRDSVAFEPVEIDLGRHPWYASVPFTVTLVNGTGASIVISAVKSSCGCTEIDATAYQGRKVEAGQRVDISGVLEVGARLGGQRKEISVLFDSGSVRTAFLTYEAYATYHLMPEALVFGRIDLEGENEGPVLSSLFTSQTARIVSSPTVDSAWLEAAAIDRGDGEADVAVHVLTRNLAYGKQHGRVLLTTDDPLRPRLSLNIVAEGWSESRPLPAHVILRSGEEKSVRFVDSAGLSARIANASCADGRVLAAPDAATESVMVRLVGEDAVDGVVVRVASDSGLRSKFIVSRAP